MTLQDQLDAITQNTHALVQPERLAVSEAAISALVATGIEDTVVKPGTKAPLFNLLDASTGEAIALADALSLGPVILKFFRGRWCPYCVTELGRWRSLYTDVSRRGASLLAISPQTPRQNTFTTEQHALPFPVLSDPCASVAAEYRIAYTVPVPHRAYYRSILVNIPNANAALSYDTSTAASWTLPLPATFLIHPNGTILFAEAHADFHVRPEPATILDALDAIG